MATAVVNAKLPVSDAALFGFFAAPGLPVFDASVFSKFGQRNPEFRILFSRRQKPAVSIGPKVARALRRAGRPNANAGVRIRQLVATKKTGLSRLDSIRFPRDPNPRHLPQAMFNETERRLFDV